MQLSLIQTPKGQSQVSALQRCLHYSATLLNTDTKGTEPSVSITEVSVLQSNRLNMGTEGTEPSVRITGVCITVKPP